MPGAAWSPIHPKHDATCDRRRCRASPNHRAVQHEQRAPARRARWAKDPMVGFPPAVGL